MTLKDFERHYRRLALFFRRKLQVSELTTPNRLKIGDNFLCRNVDKDSSF